MDWKINAFFNLYIDRCAYGKQIFFQSEYIVKYVVFWLWTCIFWVKYILRLSLWL